MNDPATVDHLSYSQISSFLRCPRAWAADKLEGKRSRVSSALIKGSTVDRVSSAVWRDRISPQDALELAEDEFARQVDQQGGRDVIDWTSQSYASALDSSIKMADAFVRDLSPLVEPQDVQVRVEKPIPGTKRTLLGFIDAVGDDDWLIDVKTGSRRMPQADADVDVQASAYAWLLGRPLRFSFFRVVDTGKNVYTETVDTTRSATALEVFEDTARAVSNLIDAGHYPASPGWQCRWCPIRPDCVGAFTWETGRVPLNNPEQE
jgi:RecB family exonuclease